MGKLDAPVIVVSDVPADPDRPVESPPGRGRQGRFVTALSLSVAVLIGCVACVVYAYDTAKTATDQSYFTVFWIGFGGWYCVTGLWACARQVTRQTRYLSILTLGVLTALPKILMSPSAPIYHDEIAHYQVLFHTVEYRHVFSSSTLLPVAHYYPGLEATAAAIHFATGQSLWTSALLTIALAHVLVPVEVGLLVEALGASSRGGALAAFIYMLNPSYVYFDMQFAYEGLALALAVGALLMYARTLRARTGRECRLCVTSGLVLAVGCVMTHHLTTILVSVVMVAMGLVIPLRRPVERRRTRVIIRASVPGGMLAALALWIGLVAPSTVSYLSPQVTVGAGQLVGAVLAVFGIGHQTAGSSGTRSLFGGAGLPVYEHAAGVVAPVVLAVIAGAIGLDWLRSDRPRSRPQFWALLVSLAYFLSLPFTLSASGSNGAHRTWATTFIGTGCMVALALCTPSAGLGRVAAWVRRRQSGRPGRVVVGLGAFVAFAVVLVGSTAQSISVDYRFPGPYEFGSDTRSVTPETLQLASWVQDNLGINARIVTDRYTGLALVAHADSIIAPYTPTMPVAEFYYDSYPPSPQLMANLRRQGYRYLIIDRRVIGRVPAEAYLFVPKEPKVVPAYDIERLAFWPWLSTLYQSADYTVYEISFSGYSRWYPSHENQH